MEIDFVVQDVYSLTRPQWKFAPNFDEAAKALQLAVLQDQKTAGIDRVLEADETTSGASSDDDNGDGDDIEQDGEGDDDSASDDDEADVGLSCSILESLHLSFSLLNIKSSKIRTTTLWTTSIPMKSQSS